MTTGTVKWFNDAKGFGFITPRGWQQGLLRAPLGHLRAAASSRLAEGQQVKFEIEQGPKGPSATNVQIA
ncbi:MAG: cold-shock protein [Chromatiales bacterium]|nr:cold-shock protein [Chromatiales bacterium]